MAKIKLDNIINLILFLYILSLYLFTYREGLFVISNALSFIFVALVIIRILLSKSPVKVNRFMLLHMLFIFMSMFSYIYAIKPQYVIRDVRTLILIFIVMIALINYIDSVSKVNKMIKYFILSGVISSVYILLISDFSQVTRFGSEIGNVNAVGMIIGISSVFSINNFISYKKKINLAYLLPMLTVILLTGSRKSLLFVLLATLFIVYIRNKSSLKGKVKFAVLGAFTLMITMYVITEVPIFYDIIGKRLEGLIALITGEGKIDNSVIVRRNMVNYGVELIKNRPLLGYGANNYRVMYGLTYGAERYSHNNFIELSVNLGFTGAFVFYLSNFVIVKSLYNNKKNGNSSAIIYPCIAIIIGYFGLGTSLVYYYSKHFSLILALASVIPSVYDSNKLNFKTQNYFKDKEVRK